MSQIHINFFRVIHNKSQATQAITALAGLVYKKKIEVSCRKQTKLYHLNWPLNNDHFCYCFNFFVVKLLINFKIKSPVFLNKPTSVWLCHQKLSMSSEFISKMILYFIHNAITYKFLFDYMKVTQTCSPVFANNIRNSFYKTPDTWCYFWCVKRTESVTGVL